MMKIKGDIRKRLDEQMFCSACIELVKFLLQHLTQLVDVGNDKPKAEG
jgi:hypothetical protein